MHDIVGNAVKSYSVKTTPQPHYLHKYTTYTDMSSAQRSHTHYPST